MSSSDAATSAPPPPSIICDECGYLPVSEESFFQCSCSLEHGLCRKCALAKTDLDDGHDFRPCFIDQRDLRPTFLPEPSLESFQLQVARAWTDPGFKFTSESRKFFARGDVDGIPTERLVDPNSYETLRDTDEVTTKKINNDYSLYRSLDRDKKEIRLAVVLKSVDSDKVGLMVGKFSYPWNRISYMPLSYCWGSLDETRNILLAHTSLVFSHSGKGSGDCQDFKCTANLEIALRAIQRCFNGHYLWVDAICINQGDLEERAYQIGVMAEIYAGGSQLGIWLGMSEEELEAAYHIKSLANAARETQQEAATCGLRNSTTEMIARLVMRGQIRYLDGSVTDQRQFRQTIGKFFDNPWFTRAWVLQEVWSSLRPDQGGFLCPEGGALRWSEVLIANTYLSWSWLIQGGHRNDLPPLWTRILLDGTQREPQCSRLPILELLESVCLDFGTADARDKLFALFAMGQETHDVSNLSPLVAPSYIKTTANVFTDFTRWHLQESSSLLALSYATHCSTKAKQGAKLHQVPSWALSPWPKITVSRLKIGEITEFKASADILHDQELITQIKHPHSLLLRGYRLGSVQTASDWYFEMRNHCGTADLVRVLESGLQEPINPHDSHVLKAIVADAYTRAKGGLGECSLLFSRKDAIQQNPICTGQRELDRLLMCMTLNGREVGHGHMDGTCQVGQLKPHEIYPIFADHWGKKAAGKLPGWDLAECFCPHMRDILLPMLSRGEVFGADGPCGSYCSAIDDDHASSVSTILTPDISYKSLFYSLVPMMGSMARRGFMQLPDGKIGLSPMGTRAGDIVVALFGGRAPFVLRPQLDDEGAETGCWEFIGECFVAEFVDGKAVEQLRDSGQESEIFDLR